ncbi:MAG: hypothetical protein ACOYD0_01975 [Candidatus Nanopelagicales bacterium]
MAQRSATVKAGLVVAFVLWLIMFGLAEAGLLVDKTWALAVGLIIGFVAIPFGIWLAKKDAADSNAH